MNDIMLISGGTLIDGTGSDPKPNEGILIEGTRILSVGKQAAVMAKDRSNEKIVENNLAPLQCRYREYEIFAKQ